ncbi:formin-2-like isoform X1 [Sinocyclocheilus grahami]|uniref:formin-2-like isoform X1 n=2 Tax=Sinocyclocheilus grahami TaxID=75366 RepID=UPI0007ACAFA1|nr:PREDICTED: formin-2-like isoform X1 [Sinocyclocheilus grahami]
MNSRGSLEIYWSQFNSVFVYYFWRVCVRVCGAMQMLETAGLRQKLLEALSLGRRQQYWLADACVPPLLPSLSASFCRGEDASELLSFITASSSSIHPLCSSSPSPSPSSESESRRRRPPSRHAVRELIMGNQDGKPKRSEGAADESAALDGTKKGKKPRGEAGKKKNKSDRSSVFPHIRKRKNQSKAKSFLSGSKEDASLDELDCAPSLCNKTPDLSGDELGHSDAEPEHPRLQEEEKKVASSGSDTDMYSFHSTAEQEDLLADIQQAIRLKQGVMLGKIPWDCKQTGDAKNTPTPDSEPFTVLEAVPKAEKNRIVLPEEEPAVNGLSEEALCAPVAVETVTKEPEAPLSPPPAVPPTNSTTSFPDLTASFESAVEAVEEDERSPPSTDTASDLRSTGSLECLTVIEELVQRRKSSVSFPPESPLVTRLLKAAVKPYPPISTCYIKTTTRQLSSPSCSPAPSPSHSPLSTRRGPDRAERRRVTGSISRSADWTEELRTLQHRATGSEETLRTSAPRPSANQSSTCSFQQVFTGQFCSASQLL